MYKMPSQKSNIFLFSIVVLFLFYCFPVIKAKTAADEVCVWNSHTGANFDLRALTATGKEKSYLIVDGDIPCTPEIEPSFSFVWNFCAKVTADSVPEICSSIHQAAAALQYVQRTSDGYHECNVIGNYDELRDDTHYSLLDSNNPAKGVSVKYPFGDKCPQGQLRSATIDVYCDNVHSTIMSALEPNVCEYHMVMKSYYGCPVECPITKHGLCDSHGHCAYDSNTKEAYCYCNDGYHGAACDSKGSSTGE